MRSSKIGLVFLILTGCILTIASAENSPTWLEAGAGFYYQAPRIQAGKTGGSVVSVSIENRSGKTAGEAIFRITLYTRDAHPIRAVERSVPQFTSGSIRSIAFRLGDVPEDTVAKAEVRALQTQDPRLRVIKKSPASDAERAPK